MANVGYIRVSSVGQKTDRQLDGVFLDKIFEDKITGASLKRPALMACLEYIREGDTLHIHSMDRLARNLADLQTIVEDLTGRDIVVKFHKEGLEFTGQDSPMSKLLMQMMGAVAEFERSMIRERQAEGIKQALKKGVKFGRQPKLTPAQRREICALVDAGWEKKAVAERFGISRPTLYKILGQKKNLGVAEAQLDLKGLAV